MTAPALISLTCPLERNLRREDLTPLKCLQSFSSVVGPNGSGKSNVIDAMLFVFGKKAKQVKHAPSEEPCISTTLSKAAVSCNRKAECKRERCSGLQLRLSKVSELIHNSSNHRNLESAKVSVQFTEVIDLVSTNAPLPCTYADPLSLCSSRPHWPDQGCPCTPDMGILSACTQGKKPVRRCTLLCCRRRSIKC